MENDPIPLDQLFSKDLALQKMHFFSEVIVLKAGTEKRARRIVAKQLTLIILCINVVLFRTWL